MSVEVPSMVSGAGEAGRGCMLSVGRTMFKTELRSSDLSKIASI